MNILNSTCELKERKSISLELPCYRTIPPRIVIYYQFIFGFQSPIL